MLACYMAHYVHIAYAHMPKPFSTLIINSMNGFCYNTIIYNPDSHIDILILQILIWKPSLQYFLPEYICVQDIEKEWNWQVNSQSI